MIFFASMTASDPKQTFSTRGSGRFAVDLQHSVVHSVHFDQGRFILFHWRLAWLNAIIRLAVLRSWL
jgi:hypothetical protein